MFIDPNGMSVYTDESLEIELIDEEGNLLAVEDMTNEQKQIYYFQQWWGENGENIEKLFGESGKYQSTDIHFVLGRQNNIKRDFNIAITTFGNKEMEDADLFRGKTEVEMTDDFGIDNLQIKIWYNPEYPAKSDTHLHEWKHVRIIFNAVQNRETVPAAGWPKDGSEQNRGTQHYMIYHGQVPEIK